MEWVTISDSGKHYKVKEWHTGSGKTADWAYFDVMSISKTLRIRVFAKNTHQVIGASVVRIARISQVRFNEYYNPKLHRKFGSVSVFAILDVVKEEEEEVIDSEESFDEAFGVDV